MNAPISFQSTQLLIKHVFHLLGIPHEILSDCSPQFSSRVWESFCSPLDAKLWLISGFHPQSNGQTERCVSDNHTSVPNGVQPTLGETLTVFWEGRHCFGSVCSTKDMVSQLKEYTKRYFYHPMEDHPHPESDTACYDPSLTILRYWTMRQMS